jgi:WD40 repeat protein
MPRRPALLLVPFALGLLGPSAARPQPPAAEGQGAARRGAPRTDRYGDPLPAGALARLGTVRLRHASQVHGLAFSPDGKTLAAGSYDSLVRFWDVASGGELRQPTCPLSRVWSLAFSPDGKTLYAGGQSGGYWRIRVDGEVVDSPHAVAVWDLKTGKARRLPAPFAFADSLALAADGKTLAAGGMGPVVVWDAVTGRERLRVRAESQGKADDSGRVDWATQVALSADGKLLARGWAWAAKVDLFDSATGKLLRTFDGLRKGVSALAFSPDGRALAAGDASGGLGLWDLRTGKRLRQHAGQGEPARAVLFTPDSKVLACARGGACQLWDAGTGKELGRLDGHEGALTSLACSPDGKRLATACEDRTIRIWDLGTRKLLHPASNEPGGDVHVDITSGGRSLVVHRLGPRRGKEPGWSANGSWQYTLRFYERFRERPTPAPGMLVGGDPVVLSPDGKLAAVAARDGQVRVLEAATGKELRRLGAKNAKSHAWPAGFSPDGKLLAICGSGDSKPRPQGWGTGTHAVRVWDVATGKAVRGLAILFQSRLSGYQARFSPCGDVLTVAEGGMWTGEGKVSFWSARSGKPLPQLKGESLGGHWFAFTSDGRFVAVGGDRRTWEQHLRDQLSQPERAAPRDQDVQVRELLTGKVISRFGHPLGATCGNLAPDGRLLALGGEDGRIGLFDPATGKLLHRLEGHRGTVHSLAFTPDGEALVSGSADTTALVWDVAAVAPTGKPPAAGELERLWVDLASNDASQAYRAVVGLSRAPKQTVPFLKSRLRAVPVVGAERLRQLIADLDSRSYATRTRATKQLGELDEIAVPALRAALKGGPPLEVRRRLEQLLALATRPVPAPDRVRALRALCCLERPATPEARAFLYELAQGAPEARLTQQARACLRRLAAR